MPERLGPERRRAQILAAAREMIAEGHDIGEVSIRELASRAGVSNAMIASKQYWPSGKASILLAMIIEMVERYGAALAEQPVPRHKRASDRAIAVIERIIELDRQPGAMALRKTAMAYLPRWPKAEADALHSVLERHILVNFADACGIEMRVAWLIALAMQDAMRRSTLDGTWPEGLIDWIRPQLRALLD